MRKEAVNNRTKTVNKPHKTCDIPPAPEAKTTAATFVADQRPKFSDADTTAAPAAPPQSFLEESFKEPGRRISVVPAPRTDQQLPGELSSSAGAAARIVGKPAHGNSPAAISVAQTTSLSKEENQMMKNKAFVRPLTGWTLPPGGGLRGGGGETTAISNGTTGWGPPPPPPSNNPGNNTTGGWGAAPPPVNQGAVSAWGSPSAPNNNNNNNINSVAAIPPAASSASSLLLATSVNSEESVANSGGPKQQQLQQQQPLPPQQQQLLNNGIKASPPGMPAPSGRVDTVRYRKEI